MYSTCAGPCVVPQDVSELQDVAPHGRVLSMWDHTPSVHWLDTLDGRRAGDAPQEGGEPGSEADEWGEIPDMLAGTGEGGTVGGARARMAQSVMVLRGGGREGEKPSASLPQVSTDLPGTPKGAGATRAKVAYSMADLGAGMGLVSGLGGKGGLQVGEEGQETHPPPVVAAAVVVPEHNHVIRIVDTLSGKLIAKLEHPEKVKVRVIEAISIGWGYRIG